MSSEPSNPYLILDVFTERALEGNPLAVFTEGEEIPSRLMQAAARELNLSETVFLLPGDEGADAQVRIFTPAAELPFAGHPVLGAAFVVAQDLGLHAVRLRTGAGIVPVHLRHDDEGRLTYGEMEQPIPQVRTWPEPEPLLKALGASDPILPVHEYVNGPQHLMVALGSVAQVTALAPDIGALGRIVPDGTVSCFTLSAPGQVTTRVFCPGLGVVEDPATGSAAGPLVLHLARHGLVEYGQAVTINQGAEVGRPSTLYARVEGNAETTDRVVVGGCAVVVARGEYRLQ